LSHEPGGDWGDLARKLDWELRYVREEDAFPVEQSGRPWLPGEAWRDWEEPYRTSYPDYVEGQHRKEEAVRAVRDALGRVSDVEKLDRAWLSAVKLHTATFTLAEYAAVIGNLRAARFGRDAAWRSTALFGALDECRHTQIPLLIAHDLVRFDPQFDWTHRLFHSQCWVGVAARRLVDEMLLLADPVEMAVATNFVFETGFTNLQFVGLAALADGAGDHLFRRMATSIQTDEARHSQIGWPVLVKLVAHDKARAQYLVDKWMWRTWLFFSVVTGIAMDYLTPLAARTSSFREFVGEWVLDQFLPLVERAGLERPWYWSTLQESVAHYHHMVYASAYTYRSTVWFDMVVPGPEERRWLAAKYPESWPDYEPVWDRISERWREAGPGLELAVQGTAIVGFCHMCQLVLSGGTPRRNAAVTAEHGGERYIFCSEPCRWIFEQEPERYVGHRDLVKRVLAGEAPGNLLALLTRYCGLSRPVWGKDVRNGDYPWLRTPDEGAR
jgi:toluene monooxygenase system protein A